MSDTASDRPRAPGFGGRALEAVVALVISATTAVVLTLILVIGVAAVPCGGDGGSPFAATASAQGRTCAFLDDAWLPGFSAIGLAGLVFAGVALANWVRTGERGRRAMTLAACLPMIPVLLALLAFPFFVALPDGCPDGVDPDSQACQTY